MKKLDIALTAAFATVPALQSVAATNDGDDKPEQSTRKPLNILYIMSDDHSYQTISAYDKRFTSTPNIDWIAENGVRFTNSFVANSLSGPSRACMLTGKHSHANGFTDNTKTFDGSQQTYPKLLQKAGYQTAMIGKWHLTSNPTGFDYWDILFGQGDYFNPDFLCNGDSVRREGYVTNIIADLTIEWLDKKRDPNKPFCLLMHNKAPHRVWSPDTCDLRLYDDITYPLPDNFYDDYEGREAAKVQEMSIINDMNVVYDLKMADHEGEIKTDNKALDAWGRSNYARMNDAQRAKWDAYYDPIIQKFKADKLSGKALAEWKYQRYMHDYMRVIASLDRNIGRVIDYLRQHGLLDNTIIVYTSDQGFFMGEHAFFDKRFMYEESFRTPLVMYVPGTKKHGDITEMVQNIDYAPTFLEAAGVDIPSDIQGESFWPLLQGEHPKNWRKALYYHYHEWPAEHAVRPHYGIRTERYSLMHFTGDLDEWELFDIQNDPSEMHNLYGQEGMESVTKELKEQLRQLQKQYNDPVGE